MDGDLLMMHLIRLSNLYITALDQRYNQFSTDGSACIRQVIDIVLKK